MTFGQVRDRQTPLTADRFFSFSCEFENRTAVLRR
jgi:hypothetical protein